MSQKHVQCRETRYFSTWKRRRQHEDHYLPDAIKRACRGSQRSVPFGDAVLAFEDCVLGVETCEELFTPAAPHIDLALSGVEIISNSSGSHHQVSLHFEHLSLFVTCVHFKEAHKMSLRGTLLLA